MAYLCANTLVADLYEHNYLTEMLLFHFGVLVTHTGRITLILTVYVLPNNAQAFLWRQNMQDYVLIQKIFKKESIVVGSNFHRLHVPYAFHLYNTYKHIYIHAYIHTYIHAHMHTYKRAYIHAHIHTYIHAHIHSYILTLLMFLLQCAGLLGQEAAPRRLGTSAICLGELSFFRQFMPVADRKALSMVVVTFFTNQCLENI